MSNSTFSTLKSSLNDLYSSGLEDLFSAPVYNPKSPALYTEEDIEESEIPEFIFRRRNRDRQPSRYPSSIEDMFDKEVKEKQALTEKFEKEISPFEPPKTKSRKRKSNKQRAEELFDFSAKPKKLGEFFREVKLEEFLPEEISLFEKETTNIEIPNELEDPEKHEELAIAEIIVAKHNSDEQTDAIYGLNLKFDDDIERKYLESFDLNPEEYDLTHLSFRCSFETLYDRKIFIERRLFSTLSHLQFSDPKFLSRHLPVKSDISNIDVRKLFNDDEHSLELLKSKFKQELRGHTSFKSFFTNKGSIRLDALKNKLILTKYRRLQCYLVLLFVLFNAPEFLTRRYKKVRDLHEVFKKSIFKNSTLASVFNSSGIGFFGDYCSFNVIKPYIANLTDSRHHQRMKEFIKERKDEKKKKKQRGNDEDLVLWF